MTKNIEQKKVTFNEEEYKLFHFDPSKAVKGILQVSVCQTQNGMLSSCIICSNK